MARYRKLDLRTWNDQKFRELSPLLPSGQSLWLYLVLGPQTSNLPGLFEASEVSMADRLGWSLEDFRKAFGEAFAKGMAKADWRARLVWLPNAPEYNRPESPNVVISWGSTFDELPECPLKWDAFQSLKAFAKGLPKAFQEAFGKGFAKAMAKDACQEQEQKQNSLRAGEPEGTCDPPASEIGRVPPGNGAPGKSGSYDPNQAWRDVVGCDPQAHETWLEYRAQAGDNVPPHTRVVNAKFLAGKGGPEAQRAFIDELIRLQFKRLHNPVHGTTEKPAKEGRSAGLPTLNP